MQLDIEDRAYGFEIQRSGPLWFLVDRSNFNNWGRPRALFATREAAIDYAYRCDAFKRGCSCNVD